MPDLKTALAKLDEIEKKVNEKSVELEKKLSAMQVQIDGDDADAPGLVKQIEALAKEQIGLVTQYGAAKKAIQDIEKRFGIRTGAGDVAIKGASVIRFGRMFNRDEGFKNYWKNRNLKGKNWDGRVELKTSFFSYNELERKASDSIDIDGVLRTPFFRQDVVEPNKRQPVHRQFVNVQVMPGDGDRVRIRREKQEHIWVGRVAVAQTSGNNTLVLERVAGLLDDSVGDDILAKIIIHNAGGPENNVVDSIAPATKTITLKTNLGFDVAAEVLITAFVFDFTKEGTFKAQSLDEYDDFDAVALTLATWVQATNQAIDDAPMLESIIERKLLSKLARTEEKLFFYGPGGSDSWLGLMRDTTIPEIKWSLQPVGTTKLDLLFFAFILVALSEHMANVAFVNWQDYQDVLTIKGTDGHYLFWQIMTTGAPAMIWPMVIIPTTVMEQGDSLAGDLEGSVTLYDRQDATIRVGEPEDFFFKNSKAILAEQRVALAVEKPLGMARIRFDSEPVPPP